MITFCPRCLTSLSIEQVKWEEIAKNTLSLLPERLRDSFRTWVVKETSRMQEYEKSDEARKSLVLQYYFQHFYTLS